MVAVEADGAVCYGLGPGSLIEQVWFTAASERCLRLGIWPTHDDMVFRKTLLQLQEEREAAVRETRRLEKELQDEQVKAFQGRFKTLQT